VAIVVDGDHIVVYKNGDPVKLMSIAKAPNLAKWTPSLSLRMPKVAPDGLLKYDAYRADIELDGDLSDWDCHEYKDQTPFYPHQITDTAIGTHCCGDQLTEFDDLPDQGGIWNGADDQASAVSFAWQPDYLFIAVKVVDDEHQNPEDEGVGKNGDSVQVVFANALQENPIFFESFFALTPGVATGPDYGQKWDIFGSRGFDSHVSAGWHHHNLVRWSDHVFINVMDFGDPSSRSGPASMHVVNASIIRNEQTHTTTYEMVFSASIFGVDTLGGGMQIGIGVSVSDADQSPSQQGPKGWSGWGPYVVYQGYHELESSEGNNYWKQLMETGMVTLRDTEVICDYGAGAVRVPTSFFAAADVLTETIFIGADEHGGQPFHGSLGMLQVYEDALGSTDLNCVYERGRQLVVSGRMAQTTKSECREAVHTGCTSSVASRGHDTPLDLLQRLAASKVIVDDGSCIFDKQPAVGEHGVIAIVDAWQHISLRGSSYTRPLIFTGVMTRKSTAQAIIRIKNVHMDSSGGWSFEIRAEQKSCHFAKPPPTAEHVSYLVIEAGVSEEGWQAGLIRVHDREWRRVSLLQRLNSRKAAPVVISNVQNYDSRIDFVTTRHHIVRPLLPASAAETYEAFFVQVLGEGVWCPDMHYYAEYFANLDLAGTPVVTQCEPTTPNWHWHSCCGGVPPAMVGYENHENPALFSARWTTRIYTDVRETRFHFSSLASGGSRIMLDDTMVLDVWEEWDSTFISDPITIGGGYHYIAYEYRSAKNRDSAPSNSYAVLAWSDQTGFNTDETNYTQSIGAEIELYNDVGWLACAVGSTGTIQSHLFEAGFVQATHSELTTAVKFGGSFASAPSVFASIFSNDMLYGHLRLLENNDEQALLATEYDTCNFVIDSGDHVLSWIAILNPSSVHLAVRQRSTKPSDTAVLLNIRKSLGLPDYLQWRNGSDPCRYVLMYECITIDTLP
jgi:hypothetical protein